MKKVIKKRYRIKEIEKKYRNRQGKRKKERKEEKTYESKIQKFKFLLRKLSP